MRGFGAYLPTMPDFYDEAFGAPGDGDPPQWLEHEDLSNWEGVGRALDRLTPEERCDAIYADWLLRLNDNRGLILPVRNLLIGQGALAANYLAELAQNADDASDRKEAHLRIVLVDDWLLVANNSRKISSANLLGLCRFFVHAAGQTVALDEQTIGRFGIGFKACYRIASEVVVRSWDARGAFAFRLPICREGDAASLPEPARLERLLTRLNARRRRPLDAAVRDINCLGYCTPEFVPELPPKLAEYAAALPKTSRGTLFCFHVRPERLEEVRNRVDGPAHGIYELCPLFLPNLRLVQVGATELRMNVAPHKAADDLPGRVEAERVTLVIRSLAEDGGTQSHSRFWRLRGTAPRRWQIALHANHEHRLRVEREDDERGATLKDGAAYAFFLLNAVSAGWPFRFHLHVAAPTNLARDNWNPDDASIVEREQSEALDSMAAWLEVHPNKWHDAWSVDSLLSRRPAQNERWEWALWQQLKRQRAQRRLVRGIAGDLVPGEGVRCVCVEIGKEPHLAWKELLSKTPQTERLFPLSAAEEESAFEKAEITAREALELCLRALRTNADNEKVHQAALGALLGSNNLSLHDCPAVVEELAAAVICRLAAGGTSPLKTLWTRRGGAELTPEWHELFGRVASWAPHRSWTHTFVFGRALREQLKLLSAPQFNPPWEEIGALLGDEAAWIQHGNDFWRGDREPCPRKWRANAVATLRVPTMAGSWIPIAEVWIEDERPTECFAGLLNAWDRSARDLVRERITKQMEEWGILHAWKEHAEKTVQEKLRITLASQLEDSKEGDAFGEVFTAAFGRARQRLDYGWRGIVEEAERKSVAQFIERRCDEGRFSGKMLLSEEILVERRAAMELHPNFTAAPAWLTEAAFQRIERLGLGGTCPFTFVPVMTFQQKEREFVRTLLEDFYRWPKRNLSEAESSGLAAMCGDVSSAQRKDWIIGFSPQLRRPLRGLFLKQSRDGATPAARLMTTLLSQAEWDAHELPSALAAVVPLAEVCIQPDRLECEITSLRDDAPLCQLNVEQVPEDLRSDSDIASFFDGAIFASPRDLNLRWRFEGERVAMLENAPYAVREGRLLVRRYLDAQESDQIDRLIQVARTNGAEIAPTQGDPFRTWMENRERLRETLLETQVRAVGYERHHILRELLQNAESAYASKREPVADAWFEFTVSAGSSVAWRKIVARHAGRTFNEPDSLGHSREDISRIWQLAARNERTPDEIGRFNRGFKSVFTVARDGSVHIRSGPFGFTVIDLLLLRPAQPQPDLPPTTNTEFTFEASVEDARAMLKLNATAPSTTPLPVLNASSLVFLRYLERISVRLDARSWSWRIRRAPNANGWVRAVIDVESAGEADAFLVYHGEFGERRFAAAVRLDKHNQPRGLENAWRVFRLTFETDREFPLDFLVNGDFEADQGRVGLQHITRSGLVEKAYEVVLARSQEELRSQPSKQAWLAWAKILHMSDAQNKLDGMGAGITAVSRRVREFFVGNIPHGGDLVAATSLEFPTSLLRRVQQQWGTAWGIATDRWIDADIAQELPSLEMPRVSLQGWIAGASLGIAQLQQIDAHLRSLEGKPGLNGVEQTELRDALRLLDATLHPPTPSQSPAPSLPQIEPWTVENLWHWWQRQGEPIADYTLDGPKTWPLLFPTDTTPPETRVQRLRDVLSATGSDARSDVWYRLFGFACLLGAGRTVTALRDFWRAELDSRQFWEKTSGSGFGDGTDRLFAEVIGTPFHDVAASGENAHYWRRIFYDVRKIHRLVCANEFPAMMLALAHSPHAESLLEFMRAGQLPGQGAWAGVFGQSAGSPLFFLVRELRRLGVIQNTALDRLAFFACAPVRRAAERIGWLDAELAGRTDFEALAAVSEKLYSILRADSEFGPRLLPFYDIPLLHLGLHE